MLAQIGDRKPVFLLLAALLAAVALVAWRFPRQPAAPGGEVLVSAASSLTNAMQEIARAYERAHPGAIVRLNFGASGALQRQIEQGAPVDVFASAGATEIDALERGGHLAPSTPLTRRDFAGNTLVLIVPATGTGVVKDWDDLRRPAVRRIAVSDPGSVPSGRYARETLTRRGLWAAVQPKLVYGENVRQTLEYVAGGNVEAGVVFATDARIAAGRVRTVAEAAPDRDHAPILYPAAVLARAPHSAAARQFLAFLAGPQAHGILARFGFTAHAPQTR